MVRPQPFASRLWTDRAAALIDDPILRLRFLRTLAKLECSRRKLFLRIFALLVLLAVGACWFLVPRAAARVTPSGASASRMRPVKVTPGLRLPEVWLVEQNRDADIYSNGLRIDNRYPVATAQDRMSPFRGTTPMRRGPPRSPPSLI